MRTQKRFSLVVAVSALCAAAAGAHAADDDFDFAQGLASRGYTDLSQQIFEEILADPKLPPAKKAEGQFGLATLKAAEARFYAMDTNEKRRKPMPEILKLFQETDDAFAKFLNQNAAHPRNLEAKLSRAKLLQDRAEYINRAIENGWVPGGTSTDALKKEVAENFNTAIELLLAVEKKAREEKSKLSPGDDAYGEVDDRLGLVWLFRISALYGKGAALPKGDPAATQALQQVLTEFENYIWDYEQTVRGLWAFYFAGLASWRLDQPQDAVDFLRNSATAFTESQEDHPSVQDVTFNSYIEWARVALDVGRRDGVDYTANALAEFQKLPARWPNQLKHPTGQRAAVWWARLLQNAGRGREAVELVQKVIKEAERTGTGVDAEASRFLAEMLQGGGVADSGGGVASLDPALLTRIARTKFREEDYRGAIRAYQAVILASDTPQEMADWGYEAWQRIGQAYGNQRRYYEAFLAFDTIEQAWREAKDDPKLSDLTNETGYWRYISLEALANQTKDAADRKRAKDAQEQFIADHPESPRTQGQEEAAAEAKVREARALRSDDPAAMQAKAREALAALNAIKPTSKLIEKVEAQKAEVHWLLGEFDQAIRLADEWLAKKRPESTETVVRRARTQGEGIALLVALGARAERAYELRKRGDPAAVKAAYQDLLDAIGRVGDRYKEQISGGDTRLDVFRAEAQIGTGAVDEAETLVWRILRENPEHPNARYLAAITAAAAERRGEQRLSELDDTQGHRQYMIRAARLRDWVLEHGAERNPEVVVSVAQSYSKGGDFERATALLEEAQRILVDAAAVETDAARKEGLESRARAVRNELIGLLVEQGRYEEAIPQLETELVRDPAARTKVLARLKRDTNLTQNDLNELIPQLSGGQRLLDLLSKAYLKAPDKDRLVATINLTMVLIKTTPEEQMHKKDYIEYLLRRGEAYLQYGIMFRQPEAFRTAEATMQNGILIYPGRKEAYDEELPGAAKRAEQIRQRAESELRKLGLGGTGEEKPK